MIYDTLIVGGGPAGLSLALYLLRNNKKVFLLEKENIGGQIANSPRVENYPSIKEISGLDFINKLFEQVSSLGLEFDLEDVIDIRKEDDLFTVKTNYHSYQAKTVALANGVKHRMLGLKNEDKLVGNGISFCALCDGPMIKGEEAYIIGDANTALQYALLLTDYCPKVHMYTLFDRFFGDEMLIEKVKSNNKIDYVHNMNLIEYLGEDKLTGLVFENTKNKEKVTVNTKNVFVCIGQIPQNDNFKHLLDLDRGYALVDEKMETKTPGLFVIGDSRKKDVRQLVTACSDGAIAAIAILKRLG